MQLAVTTRTELPKQTAARGPELGKSSQSQNSGTKSESKAQIFSNGTLNLNRIYISDNQFILVNPKNSTPYAIFKASTKKDVYRVQLQDGTQTLGYIEDGAIIIELPNADGSYRKEVFKETAKVVY